MSFSNPIITRNHLSQTAMFLMLGFILGFLYFCTAFPYACAVPTAGMATLTLIAVAILAGAFVGYMYQDILQLLAGAFALPALGVLFCFALYSTPALSRDISTSGLGEGFLALSLVLMVPVLMSFLAILIAGFISLYIAETDS